MASGQTRDARRRETFLSGLAAGESVSAAASASGASRASIYRWRERSVRFARQWDQAVEGGADLLEKEAWRRAVEGTARPVFARGVQVGEVRQYSDRLLMFLLQAKRPQVYRPCAALNIRQPEISEDLGRRVKAARERVRAAASLPPPPKQDAPKRPPDPPAPKDDDDPPTTSAAFRARHGRYPTGYEVMKLGIRGFQAADVGAPVSQSHNEYLPRAQRGEGGAQRRMGKGHKPQHRLCSPSPSALRAPSPQAGKVMMSDGKANGIHTFQSPLLDIKCFQESDLGPTHDDVARQEPRSSPTSRDASVSPTHEEYLPRAQRGGGGPKDRMGKGHKPQHRVCSPSPSGLRPPSPQAGKVLVRGGQSGATGKEGEVTKAGLGRTLVRLCRAGIAAVTGLRARESIDGVSHLSHATHRMPILRGFWPSDRGSSERQIETKQAPMVGFTRKTCLISGLRLPVSHPLSPSPRPA